MKCYQCGQEIDNSSEFCPFCGMQYGAGETIVLDGVMNPYAKPSESGTTEPLTYDTVQVQQDIQMGAVQVAAAPRNTRPVVQFSTNRSLAKMFFLSLITFGIYGIVQMCKIVTELNVVASRYDGKRTMPLFPMMFLSVYTAGILLFVWYHKMSNRIGAELKRRGIDYDFNAKTFWLWQILGALIVVGPLVFVHKFMKAMNLLNADFNENG